MRTVRHRRRNAARQVAGWCVLLLFALACTPAGFGLTALAGALDRNHHLGLRCGGDSLQVVLQHRQNLFAHHHGVVAQALTLFAQPNRGANPDHSIQFRVVELVSSPAQFAAPKLASGELPDFCAREIASDFTRAVASHFIAQQSPRMDCGRLICLHSALLLI